MSDSALEALLLPVLRDLHAHLGRLVIIGGWVPQLHRSFGPDGEWAITPLGTTEVDVLLTQPDAASIAGITVSEALEQAGFHPVGGDTLYVWERNSGQGQRIEFFVDHQGSWDGAHSVQPIEGGGSVEAISLPGLNVLRDNSVLLPVPLGATDALETVASVRVPELGVFAVHKGAHFQRRPDRARKAKDLHYIVDLMQSGEPQVRQIENNIRGYCEEGREAAAVSRVAHNNLHLLLAGNQPGPILLLLAEALAERDGVPHAEALGRARGFLMDFVELIPQDCG